MGGILSTRTLVKWNMEKLSKLHAQNMDVVEHRPGPAGGGEPATPLTRGQAHRVWAILGKTPTFAVIPRCCHKMDIIQCYDC